MSSAKTEETAALEELAQEIRSSVEDITQGSKNGTANRLILMNDCECLLDGVPEAKKSLSSHLCETGTEKAKDYLEKLKVHFPGATDEAKDESVGKKAGKMHQGGYIEIPTEMIKPHPAVQGFYPIFNEVLDGIVENMKQMGFDKRFPVHCVVKDGIYLCWEGLTRCKAAAKVSDIKKIPVVVSEFASEDELMSAVVKAQSLRRGMNDAVVLKSVEALEAIEMRKAKIRQGERTDITTSVQPCAEVALVGHTTNEALALVIGKGSTTVAHARKVLKSAEHKSAVFAGKISLNSAYEKIIAAEKKESKKEEHKKAENGKRDKDTKGGIPGRKVSQKTDKGKRNLPKDSMRIDPVVAEPAKLPGKDEMPATLEPPSEYFQLPSAALEFLLRKFPKEFAEKLNAMIVGEPETLKSFFSKHMANTESCSN